jgi:hypothetical protein
MGDSIVCDGCGVSTDALQGDWILFQRGDRRGYACSPTCADRVYATDRIVLVPTATVEPLPRRRQR